MALEISRIAILFFASTLVPQSPTVFDRVDVVELNHVYDSDGRRVLSQIIFWDWNRQLGRHQVVAWRIWNDGQPYPFYDLQQGGHCLLFRDDQLLRLVHAHSYRESWTQYDPEIIDRARLPQNQRRGLSRVEQPASTAQTQRTRR